MMRAPRPRFSNHPTWTEISHHTVYLPPLDSSSVVLDLGASTAAFSRGIHELCGCRCHAVEALPRNFACIEDAPYLTGHLFAMGGTDGPITIHSVDEAFASAAIELAPGQRSRETMEIEGITLASLLRRLEIDRVNLLKVDIEGAELGMFEAADDATLKRIDQMTVEFHDFMDPRQTPDVEKLIRRLRSLGFWAIKFSGRYHGDVVFIDPERTGFSRAQRLYAEHVLRPVRGMRRIVSRRLSRPSSISP